MAQVYGKTQWMAKLDTDKHNNELKIQQFNYVQSFLHVQLHQKITTAKTFLFLGI